MFGFGKKKLQSEKKHTLKLPLLESKDFTPDKIAEYLRSGIPILAVTDPSKQTQIDGHWSFEMLVGVEMNGLRPSVSMYRKEGPFLCKYRAYQFEGDPTLYFVLWNVYEMKNSNIMELCNRDLREACELYHDDEKKIETQVFAPNDFTEEEGLEFFRNHPKERSIYIGKDRIVKQTEEPEAEV